MLAITIRQPALQGCGDGCGDLGYRVPGSIIRPELPATPKLIGHVVQEPISLLGQELRCGRSERREFSVIEAEDRRQRLGSF
jgi:hypothetical protein